jgi:hypothetical protein
VRIHPGRRDHRIKISGAELPSGRTLPNANRVAQALRLAAALRTSPSALGAQKSESAEIGVRPQI